MKTFLVNGKTLKLVYLKDQYLAQFIQHFCLWFVFNSWQYLLCNFADDSLQYQPNKDSVAKSLEELSIPLLSWFTENKLQLNLDKCHLIDNGTENKKIKLDYVTITISKKEKFLGIIFDDRLKFQYHTENVCKKASLKRITACCSFRQSTTKANFTRYLFSVTI